MNIFIYFIIVVLFGVLIFWTWNNTKDFEETKTKIIFCVVGIIVLGIVTLTIFNISKIGIKYQNKEIESQVRKIAVFLFIPINGFLSLPHIAKIKTDIKTGAVPDEKSKKRIIILATVIVVVTILEIFYLKDFQNGIIEILNNKQE